jgi:hypothetical protein
MDPLDYALTYPKKPTILAQYIRKDKGGSGRKLPKEFGTAEFTVIKCEGGRMPRYRK